MESEWVKIMPFIERPLPATAVNSDFPGVSESKEIYEFFQSKNPQSPIDAFKEFYVSLPNIPKIGQSRSEQVIEAVRLMKLADKIKIQLESAGVKY